MEILIYELFHKITEDVHKVALHILQICYVYLKIRAIKFKSEGVFHIQFQLNLWRSVLITQKILFI
jgi:hypothetical protein